MAGILDKYGIKEVADVTFYHIDGTTGKPDYPVLYLDTLKVSTIEQTGEEAEARGGKGNPLLLLWDYGKEINVTLEDALFSAKSMAIMFGGGVVKSVATNDTHPTRYIMRTEVFTATTDVATITTDTATWGGLSEKVEINGKSYNRVNPKFYLQNNDGTQSTQSEVGLTNKSVYLVTYDLKMDDDATVIEISPNTFPGEYYVTGDTYARSATNGEDEFFQFIIPRAKVQSEETLTLEAEGDPTVFNMNLRVLRPKDGAMMKLVKYNLSNGGTTDVLTSEIVHNHDLKQVTTTNA